MSSDRRIPLGAVLGVGAVALIAHMFMALQLGRGYAIPVTIIGVIGAAVVLGGPLGQALAERIRGGSGGHELPPEQVLNELDELRTRLTELEERADFSERMLAQRREGESERA